MKLQRTRNLTKVNPSSYQSGGFLDNFLDKLKSPSDASSVFKAFGPAGEKYKDIFGGIQSSGLFTPKANLPEWNDQTAEEYRKKVISNLKLKKVGDYNYKTPDGQDMSYQQVTDLAGKLYDQTKEGNKSFNEQAPLGAQMAGLFELNRQEQEELQNKKQTIQDYPVVKSSYAPAGFSEDGGRLTAYNNLMGLFANGGNPQQGGMVTMAQQRQGYKDGSPWANQPQQTFYTDTLTMDGVSRPIMAIPNNGMPVVMPPNSGNYNFPGAQQIVEVPLSKDGGMYYNDIDHAKFGDFFKKVGNVVSDYGRGMADSFGNMTGLYDLSNEKYKTIFGQKIAGSVDKYSRGIGKVTDLAASIFGGPMGKAIVGAKSSLGSMLNPQGLGAAQEQRNAAMANLDPTGKSGAGASGLSGLLGGAGGAGGLGGMLGGLLGGAGGAGGMLGGLLGGAGGAGGLGGLLGMGEDGGRMSYNNLNAIFQEGGAPQEQQMPQEQDLENNKFMQLEIEQQLEVYKSLLDFILQNGIDALEEQYPEEYQFFEAFNDFIDGEDEEEDNDSNYPEQMANGGIPQRYRNLGFNKVGQKRQSTRPGKKWMVLAKKGDDYKIVHGGAKGMSDFTKHKNLKRRGRFWDRMGGINSSKAKDPFSPLYWHKRFGTW